VPFRNHLCAQEYIGFPLLEIRDDTVVCAFSTGGILIHTKQLCFGKELQNFFFDPLSSHSLISQGGPAAFMTHIHGCLLKTTVVAAKPPVFLVKCQTYSAMGTTLDGTAGCTPDERRKSAPVLKQDNLFAFFKPFLDFGLQLGRDKRIVRPFFGIRFCFEI